MAHSSWIDGTIQPADSLSCGSGRRRPMVVLFGFTVVDQRQPEFDSTLLLKAPSGLLRVAGGLREEFPGICCRLELVELAVAPWQPVVTESIRSALDAHQPAVVGISALSLFMLPAIEIARIVRAWDPNVPIVLGGHHASAFPDGVGRYPDFDYYVAGEGARSGPRLFSHLINGVPDLASIPGIAYRAGGTVVRTGPPEHHRELDWLPRLAWDMFDLGSVQGDPQYGYFAQSIGISFPDPTVVFPYIASRGCPFTCSFCESIHHVPFSHFSPERVIEELKQAGDLIAPLKMHITFLDNLIHHDRRWFRQILSRIHGELSCDISLGVKADIIDTSLIDCMVSNGVKLLIVFPESASLRILQSVNKSYNRERFMANVRYASEQGILIIGCFVVGWPEETSQEFDDTLELAADPVFDSILIYPLVVLAGAEIGSHLARWGIEPDSLDYFAYLREPTKSTYNLTSRRHISDKELGEKEYLLNREKCASARTRRKFEHLGLSLHPRLIDYEVGQSSVQSEWPMTTPEPTAPEAGRLPSSGLGRGDPATASETPIEPEIGPDPEPMHRPVSTPAGAESSISRTDRWLLDRLGRELPALCAHDLSIEAVTQGQGARVVFTFAIPGSRASLQVSISREPEARYFHRTRLFWIAYQGQTTEEGIKVLERVCQALRHWEGRAVRRLPGQH